MSLITSIQIILYKIRADIHHSQGNTSV